MKGNGSSIDIDMMVDAAAWREALPALKSLVDRTLLAVWRRAGDDSPAEASLVLSSDAEMRKLNFQHRAVDHSTNVLAFPLGEPMQPDGPRHLGDIVLAYETVVREAARDAKPLDAHVAHLLVHGLLHLLGHDHESESDAEAMEQIEVEIMASLGYPNPYIKLPDAAE